jgi:hypothetical protein
LLAATDSIQRASVRFQRLNVQIAEMPDALYMPTDEFPSGCDGVPRVKLKLYQLRFKIALTIRIEEDACRLICYDPLCPVSIRSNLSYAKALE